ncbi:MAG: DNA photolyase family protein [Cyanobacteria bacterium REEB446]|nr:DNA photolyase family protein [Cyanobacteria bacterium REEB446]
MTAVPLAIILFRNDLRLADNPALHYAIAQGKKILPVFIYEDHFDNGNEANFERLGAATKLWLHYSLKSLSESISEYGSKLLILKGNQKVVLNALIDKFENSISSVYWNRRYEPHHIKLDTELKEFLTHKADESAEIEARGQYLEVKSFGGNLLIEPWELLNKQSKPYQVYTPFSKQYFRLFESSMADRIRPLEYKISAENFLSKQSISEIMENAEAGLEQQSLQSLCSIEDLNLKDRGEENKNAENGASRYVHPWVEKMTKYIKAGEIKAREALEEFIQTNSALNYGEKRNSPFLKGTSQLSTNLHFGEISVRQVYAAVNNLDSAKEISENKAAMGAVDSSLSKAKKYDYLKQLIWREFAHYLMYHFPHTVNQPLREEFKHFNWRSLDEAEDENANVNENAEIGVQLHARQMLKKWQRGETGYPIVDAGMKELWETGWMHNRVRMIAASFLVKDLRIHWIEGAKWFWDTLFDADLANNTMGWQWVAGSGADAAPYFRIFNPTTQSERFDPDGVYIKRWLQSLRECPSKDIHAPFAAGALRLMKLGKNYPYPLVDHDVERKIALDEFKKLREESL